MKDVKEAVREMAQHLSKETTWDEVMYRIYVLQKVEAGLKDADEGRIISHDEVFEQFGDYFDLVD